MTTNTHDQSRVPPFRRMLEALANTLYSLAECVEEKALAARFPAAR